jgi:hypothetical protein
MESLAGATVSCSGIRTARRTPHTMAAAASRSRLVRLRRVAATRRPGSSRRGKSSCATAGLRRASESRGGPVSGRRSGPLERTSIPLPGPVAGRSTSWNRSGREPYGAFGTIHGPGYAGRDGCSGTIQLEEELASDFHLFAAEWSERQIEWSLDGRAYHVATPDDVPGAWVFDHPFYLLINLAVGGDLGGPVAEETTFPQQLLVDYLRVYAPSNRTN